MAEQIQSLRGRIEEHLFAPINLAPLVFFRVLFGGIMLWEVTRYLSKGWIRRYYLEPEFFFTYYGFEWIHPWPGDLMYVHFLGLGILSVFITFGLWYRVSTILFFLSFTYVFLLDHANYLNHFYLISLISFLLIFIPAHRAASLDIVRRPNLHAGIGPTWPLWLLRAQVGIAYFYGGIAKLNSDWLRGEPMRLWLSERTDFPLIGSYFLEPWAPYLFSYGGLFLDLFIVPCLLWKRTRVLAYLVGLSFHLMNDQLFSIGIFPWFMIGATALFFEPNQFVPFRRKVERLLSSTIKFTRSAIHTPTKKKHTIIYALTLYMAFQILMPLRHHLYPGNVNWTEEGHDFSWHMKLRSKRGTATFIVTDPRAKKSWEVDPYDYLTSRQMGEVESHPEMIVLFSHYLESELQKEGHGDVEIRAVVNVSLNAREPQLLVDPNIDLTRRQRSLKPADWILPLTD
jgi:vitamin K-dependent gamma-carboxylase